MKDRRQRKIQIAEALPQTGLELALANVVVLLAVLVALAWASLLLA